jgi:hypothetical protein
VPKVPPLGVAKDAVERFGVRLLDAVHRSLQRLTDVRGYHPNIGPMAVVGDLETIMLREQRVLLVVTGLDQCCLVVFIVYIGDTFSSDKSPGAHRA